MFIQKQVKFYLKIILTTGTFLNGLIHIGDEKIPAADLMKTNNWLSEQQKIYA